MSLGIQRFVFAIVILATLGTAVVQVWARTSRTPDTLGVVDGSLGVCPAGSANCVVSGHDDPDTTMPVIQCPGQVGAELLATVRDVITAQDGITVADETGNYVHFVATTPFFGFRDDVEILMRANLRFVDIRSASRLGSDDLGVNRQRVLEILAAVEARCGS